MPHLQLTECRIKFQLCVGRFPDGRMRTRTFGIKNVRPDVGADDVAAVARAIAPLLAHPIVRVYLRRKYRLVWTAPAALFHKKTTRGVVPRRAVLRVPAYRFAYPLIAPRMTFDALTMAMTGLPASSARSLRPSMVTTAVTTSPPSSRTRTVALTVPSVIATTVPGS